MKHYLFLLFFLLSACAEVGPFVDARKEAGHKETLGESKPGAPAICYNPLWSDMAQVEKLAQEACAQNKQKAYPVKKEYFKCSLATPAIAYYECKKN